MADPINYRNAIPVRDAIENALVALRASGDKSGAIDTLRWVLVQNVEGIDPAADLLPELCDVFMFG